MLAAVSTPSCAPPWDALPGDVLGAAARTVSALAAMHATCRAWHAALDEVSDAMWKRIAFDRFPRLERIIALSPPRRTPPSFHALYLEQLQAEMGPVAPPQAECSAADFLLTIVIHNDSDKILEWSQRDLNSPLRPTRSWGTAAHSGSGSEG